MKRTLSHTPRVSRRRVSAVAVLGALTLLTAACGGTVNSGAGSSAAPADEAATAASEESEPAAVEAIDRLQIMAPADPGGGWDQSARAMASAIEESGLAGSVQVSNVGGAGGTVGLAELSNERSEEFLMMMGLVMVGAIETNESQATLEDTTPIARLTAEDEIIVVPKDSPFETIDDLVEAMRNEGRGVSIAGGSAGGTDHILAALIAQDAEVPIEDLNYIAYSGGGESLAALLGNQVSAGISGVGEYAEQVRAGELRALAVSGEERIEDIDAPTLTEAGIDVELSNWRGVVAPGDISDEGRERLLTLVEDMQASDAWQAQVERNGWGDTYLAGDEFDTYLEEERVRVRGVLEDIGLVQ